MSSCRPLLAPAVRPHRRISVSARSGRRSAAVHRLSPLHASMRIAVLQRRKQRFCKALWCHFAIPLGPRRLSLPETDWSTSRSLGAEPEHYSPAARIHRHAEQPISKPRATDQGIGQLLKLLACPRLKLRIPPASSQHAKPSVRVKPVSGQQDLPITLRRMSDQSRSCCGPASPQVPETSP